MIKRAFTIAEVIITLTIVGVIAAMILPNRIDNVKKQERLTRLQNIYSMLNAALKKSEVDNGPIVTWNEEAYAEDAEDYLNTYWKPYLKVLNICRTYEQCQYSSNQPFYNLNGTSAATGTGTYSVVNDRRIPVILSNGTMLSFSLSIGNSQSWTHDKNIFVDVNGGEGPNTYGKDVFLFVRTEVGIKPSGYDKTKQEIYNDCNKTGEGRYCAARIINDGWQIVYY